MKANVSRKYSYVFPTSTTYAGAACLQKFGECCLRSVNLIVHAANLQNFASHEYVIFLNFSLTL
jgi:hypothetical protein